MTPVGPTTVETPPVPPRSRLVEFLTDGRTIIAAGVSLLTAGAIAGIFYSRLPSRADLATAAAVVDTARLADKAEAKATAADHETRLRNLETTLTTVSTDTRWLTAAVRAITDYHGIAVPAPPSPPDPRRVRP